MNHSNRFSRPFRAICLFVCLTFTVTIAIPPTPGNAQIIAQTFLGLPAPGAMVGPSAVFTPPLVRGMTIHPDNPFQFDFIIDTGDENLQGEAFREESEKLIKYFLASLTVPDGEFWVNLSPEEKDRIVGTGLGETQMGIDMLAQDYLLKQLTATFMYPEKELGKKFWKRVHQLVKQQYGNIDIPMDNFHKVWIVPDKATVYEHNGSVFVVERHLRVLLEKDYLAQQNNQSRVTDNESRVTDNEPRESKTSSLFTPHSSLQENQSVEIDSIIRDIIIPAIEHEVNHGKNFAQLRQIYNSMILAAWYKRALKDSLLSQAYVNQNKVSGVDIDDKTIPERIYAQYLEAFRQGVYNYIKEEVDPLTNKIVPKQYFSGGVGGVEKIDIVKGDLAGQSSRIRLAVIHPESKKGRDQRVTWKAVDSKTEKHGEGLTEPSDSAMLTRRQFLTTTAALLGAAALGYYFLSIESNSKKINVSGSHLPQQGKFPSEWVGADPFIVDVDKTVRDRNAAIRLDWSMGFLSVFIKNISRSSLAITGVETYLIWDDDDMMIKNSVDFLQNATHPDSPRMVLAAGEEESSVLITPGWSGKTGKRPNQLAVRIKREDGNDTYVLFLGLQRMIQRDGAMLGSDSTRRDFLKAFTVGILGIGILTEPQSISSDGRWKTVLINAGPKVLPDILDTLKNTENKQQRLELINILGSWGLASQAAAPVLVELLMKDSGDEALQHAVVRVLPNILPSKKVVAEHYLKINGSVPLKNSSRLIMARNFQRFGIEARQEAIEFLVDSIYVYDQQLNDNELFQILKKIAADNNDAVVDYVMSKRHNGGFSISEIKILAAMGPAARKAVPLLKSTLAKSKHFISYDDFLLSRAEDWYKNEIEAFDYIVFYEYASTIAEALLILDDAALPGEISEWHYLIQENAKIKHWTGLNNLKMVFAPIVSGLAISLTAGGTVYGLRQVFKSMKVQTGHVSPDSRDRAMLSVDDIKRELHSSQDGRLLTFRKLEYKLQQHHQVLRYWPNTFDLANVETLRDMSDITEILIIGESGAYTITPGYLIEHWSAWEKMRGLSDGMMIISVGGGIEKIAILDMHQDDFIEGNARDQAMLTDAAVLLGAGAIATVIGFKGLTFLANKYGYKKVSHYAFLIALTGSLICMVGCKPNKEDHSSKQSEAQDTQNGISVKPAISGANFKDAFEKKNYAALQGFLSFQPDFLQASGNDYYLGVAAKLGDVRMVEFLLNHGANPDGVFQERTVLERAISGSFENEEIALLLIKKGADLTKINSLLIGAIENQWISVAAAILEKGADINEVRASDGMTALMVAIANGNDSAVKMLIDNGADVDLPMLNGVTPLMVAVKRQDLEMVRRLLKNGANPLIKDVSKKTAIDIAKGYPNEIIQNILQAFHPESKMNIFTMGKSMDPVGVLISKMQIESSTGSKNEVNNIPEEYIEVGEVLKLFSRSVLLDDVKIAKEAFLQADGSKHLFWREGDIMALMLAIKNHANNVAMFMLENRPILKNSQDVVLALSLATNNDDFMRKYAAYVKDISYLSEGVAFQIYVKLLEKRDLSLMEELLKKGLPVNFFGMQNLTPLDLTVLSGQFKATAMLLNYGADPLLLRSSAELSLYSSSLLNMIKMSDNRSYSSILKSIAPYHPDNVKIILEVMDGNIAQVRTLIRNGANVNMSTPSGMNPLQLAVESENFEMVELLVQNGANVNHPGFLKSTPFLSAIISANQKLIDFLIKNGAKLDVANDRGDTPIMLAAETNNLSLGEYLIEKGININQQNRFLKSPLTAAAYHGNILFVKLLVDSGVDLKSQGGMAAYQAAMRGHHQVLEFLLQQGVSPTYEYHVPGSFIGSIMAAAVNAGQIQSVSVLLKHGVDINAKMGFDILARTPLHSAVISNNFQMAEFLLNNGADVKKEILMVPVLHASMFQGGPELIRLLIKSGCDINQSAGDLLRTPAHEAADFGNLKALEVLSESGADLTKKDADGKLPIDLARQQGHKDIVNFFEQSLNADQSMLGSTAELMAKVMSVGLMGVLIQSQAIATQVLASYDPIAPILDAAKAEQMAKMILIGVGAVALAGVTAFLTYRYFHNIKKTGKDNTTQDHVPQKSTDTDISDHAMNSDQAMLGDVKHITKVMSFGLMGAFLQSQAIVQTVLGAPTEAGFGSWLWEIVKTHPFLNSGAVLVGVAILYGTARWYWLTQTIDGNIYRVTNGGALTRRHAAKKLSELGDKRAVEALIKVLSGPVYYGDCESVAEALEKLGLNHQQKDQVARIMKGFSGEDYNYLSNLLNHLGDARGAFIYLYHDQELRKEYDGSSNSFDGSHYVVDKESYWEGPVPRSKADQALLVKPDASSEMRDAGIADAPGGIDFNPQGLDLKIKRDGNGIPLPLPQQPLEIIQIEGLTPVIINVVPANIPMMLGLKKDDEIELSLN